MMPWYIQEARTQSNTFQSADLKGYCIAFGYVIIVLLNSRDCGEEKYLDFLPLSNWTDVTVRGKILSDIINTIVLLLLRKKMGGSGLSASELYGKSQSLMCFRNNNEMVTVETLCKQVKEYYKLLGIEVPAHVKADSFMKENLLVQM